MLLMIDNYDSFTFNLVQYFEKLGAELEVVRNNEVALKDIERLSPEKIVISPGPCDPDKAGLSLSIVQHFADRIPILGVCLGHQTIAQQFGGKVVRGTQVMHGKTSLIHHHNQGVFQGLPSPFTATRYHSLVVEKESFPDCLEMTAWTCSEDGEPDVIMGLKHRSLPLQGVQFHPESILSEFGYELLQNFLQQK